MLAVGLCESLCSVTWRSCLPGTCHHFSFQKGQGKAGTVCVLLGETRLEVQLCDGWAGCKGRLHRSQPEQRAGCYHRGCWGRCQARTGGFLGSLEKQKGFVSVLEPAQEYVVTNGLGLQLLCWSLWFPVEPRFLSPASSQLCSVPPLPTGSTDWQCVLRASGGSFSRSSFLAVNFFPFVRLLYLGFAF